MTALWLLEVAFQMNFQGSSECGSSAGLAHIFDDLIEEACKPRHNEPSAFSPEFAWDVISTGKIPFFAFAMQAPLL
ncbi:unnamed protein product [Strongylus vulgaris]|uniref:Uncharacterized protein n=1 Tax=Strongylus vulgaris TaxID=40348 RepID=A0A3P7J0Y6_STRVU|nr:unnamed protein product [Strongylus vulgaris]